MKHTSSLWQLAGFALSTLGGTLLHFLYDWTGGSMLVAPFSGVNESTWEHMKLLFWPLFLFALIQLLFYKEQENYWCVKLVEILLGLVLIPALFYTYNGVIGKSPDWINIAIFYITALLVFLFEWWAFKYDRLTCGYPRIAFAIICLIGVLFVVFTFSPPHIQLFQDPITEKVLLARRLNKRFCGAESVFSQRRNSTTKCCFNAPDMIQSRPSKSQSTSNSCFESVYREV